MNNFPRIFGLVEIKVFWKKTTSWVSLFVFFPYQLSFQTAPADTAVGVLLVAPPAMSHLCSAWTWSWSHEVWGKKVNTSMPLMSEGSPSN